jgi:hypothetical protein
MQQLMRKIGIAALGPKPHTRIPAPEHSHHGFAIEPFI